MGLYLESYKVTPKKGTTWGPVGMWSRQHEFLKSEILVVPFLGLPYRILNIDHKKELPLWVRLDTKSCHLRLETSPSSFDKLDTVSTA